MKCSVELLGDPLAITRFGAGLAPGHTSAIICDDSCEVCNLLSDPRLLHRGEPEPGFQNHRRSAPVLVRNLQVEPVSTHVHHLTG